MKKKTRNKRIVHSVDHAKIKKNIEDSSFYEEDKGILECLANNLNKELKKQNIDQEDFCEKIGVSAGALSYYRNGKRIPSSNILARMSIELNVTTDYLLGLSTVKSVERDLQKVSKLTGLTDEAIEVLSKEVERAKRKELAKGEINYVYNFFGRGLHTINYLIEKEEKYGLFKNLANYLWFNENNKKLIDMKEEITNDDLSFTYTVREWEALTKVRVDEIIYVIKKDIESKK